MGFVFPASVHCMRIQYSIAEVFNGGVRGTVQNGARKSKNTSSDLETISQGGKQREQVYNTNLSSFSRSSRASRSVSMRQCSRATRQRRTASSRSVRSGIPSRKLEKSIVDHNLDVSKSMSESERE